MRDARLAVGLTVGLRLGLCLCLGLWAAVAGALEVEDRRVYPGTTDRTLSIVSTADLEVFEYAFGFDLQSLESALAFAATHATQFFY